MKDFFTTYKKPIICLLGFTILTWVKQLFIENCMEISFVGITTSILNILLMFSIYSFVCILFQRHYIKAMTLLYTILILFMFSDLVHYRYFHMPISIYSFQSAGQVSSIGSSIKALIKAKDLLLFIDIIFLWILAFKIKVTPLQLSKQKKFIAGILIVVLLSFIPMANKVKLHNEIYTINQLGLVNYHLQDLYNYVFESGIEEEVLQQHLSLRRNNYMKTEDRQHFGLIDGKNIIVIQVEALQNFVLNRKVEGQPITPVMNSLIAKDSIYFDRYYQQLGRGNTSDAEFVSHNSVYPSMRTFSYKEFEGNDFYTLPLVLKEKGYQTIVFHGNEPNFWNRKNIYPSLGFDTFISSDEMIKDEIIGMGISDDSVFKQSIPYISKLKSPFYSFYITLTSHSPFLIPEELRGLNIEGELKDTPLEHYFQSINYFDRVLGEFIEDLKKNGIYEDSVIVIYGDHFGVDIRNEKIRNLASSFLGKPYDFEEFLNVGLIIHIPGSGIIERHSIAGGQIDFFPTMLNLLGINEIKGHIFGRDLLNSDEGFVAHQTYMLKGSFIDNEKVFEMSRDGVYENSRAWRIDNHEPVPLKECRENYERALREIHLSDYIMANNLSARLDVELDKENEVIYVDVVGHWAEEAIENMYEKGIMTHTIDGRFYPDEPMKKGEFIQILSKSFNWKDAGQYEKHFEEHEVLTVEEALLWIREASGMQIDHIQNLKLKEMQLTEVIDRASVVVIIDEILNKKIEGK